MYKKYEGLFVRVSKDTKGQKFLSLIPKSFLKPVYIYYVLKVQRLAKKLFVRPYKANQKSSKAKKATLQRFTSPVHLYYNSMDVAYIR